MAGGIERPGVLLPGVQGMGRSGGNAETVSQPRQDQIKAEGLILPLIRGRILFFLGLLEKIFHRNTQGLCKAPNGFCAGESDVIKAVFELANGGALEAGLFGQLLQRKTTL